MPTIFFPPEALDWITGTHHPRGTLDPPRPLGTHHPRAVLEPGVDAFAWGAVAGTTAGELLHVGYSGAVVTGATLELADGRILNMGISGGELVILLPPDTPNGAATVTVTLADASTHQLVIALVGTVVLPPVTPGVGPRRQPSRRPERRQLTSASRIELSSSTRLRATHAPATRIELRGTQEVHRGPAPVDQLVHARGRIRLGAAGTRQRVHQRAPASMVLSAAVSVQRRDGPRLEEALLLLELV